MKKQALFYEKLGEKVVQCHLCAHECRVKPDGYGICGVRQNINGELYTLVYGELIANNVDPIEKKPLYHVMPGSRAYSIATMGCNFKCGFCQNWRISQLNKREMKQSFSEEMTPEAIVKDAKNNRCQSIAYTYTEPTIYFEYAYDTAKLARDAGIKNVFVTNGYMTKDALNQAMPVLDAANVDLKAFNDDFYKHACEAHLRPVLDSIRHMHENGIWLEITTLIIPGENDSEEELGQIAEFIAGLSPDIPWHISAFHPDYNFIAYTATPRHVLEQAMDIGKKAGLHFIYPGNVLAEAHTPCPHCQTTVMERSGMRGGKDLTKNGACPSCGRPVPGIWS